MDRNQAHAIASDILAREGYYLDTQDWDAWLALYAEDVEYWVPVWKAEDQLVGDVDTEVSLIYHEDRVGLEERILRIRTRKSVTAMPLPRTTHLSGNVLIGEAEEDRISGTAAWMVDEFDPRISRSTRQAGLYEFTIACQQDTWVFTRKKIILVNDVIPTVVDFYNL
jgi:benzoate/toluate 1,2-dioxygenase beta subunit/2,4,5-trichlorophenoxyacetic acid oxygenase 2